MKKISLLFLTAFVLTLLGGAPKKEISPIGEAEGYLSDFFGCANYFCASRWG